MTQKISPIARMRRYTTVSLCGMLLFYVILIAGGAPTLLDSVLLLVVGGFVTAQTMFWERRPPLWLSIVTVTGALALWALYVVQRQLPITAVLVAVAVGLHVSFARNRRTLWVLGGLALILSPVGIAYLLSPAENWSPWLVAASAGYLGAMGLFALNNYGWGLYLEIDAARRTSAELAVSQERYRFAADLHDIQGHTLHVIRLKTQLATKLIDRDPAAAKVQLVEAEQLISETLANTRNLAFGERQITLASELANAQQLFEAAGIAWTVTGHATPGPANRDELFGLVVREATTNILRHAQSTAVEVRLEPHRLAISNDGSQATTRPLSGLAVLGERFAAVGGSLRTSVADGVFTTEAVAR